jgi:hypothetical protein
MSLARACLREVPEHSAHLKSEKHELAAHFCANECAQHTFNSKHASGWRRTSAGACGMRRRVVETEAKMHQIAPKRDPHFLDEFCEFSRNFCTCMLAQCVAFGKCMESAVLFEVGTSSCGPSEYHSMPVFTMFTFFSTRFFRHHRLSSTPHLICALVFHDTLCSE